MSEFHHNLKSNCGSQTFFVQNILGKKNNLVPKFFRYKQILSQNEIFGPNRSTDKYVGFLAERCKDRYSKHKQDLDNPPNTSKTTLAEHVWD